VVRRARSQRSSHCLSHLHARGAITKCSGEIERDRALTRVGDIFVEGRTVKKRVAASEGELGEEVKFSEKGPRTGGKKGVVRPGILSAPAIIEGTLSSGVHGRSIPG